MILKWTKLSSLLGWVHYWLAFSPPNKAHILPNRYPHWLEIKQELQILAAIKNPSKAVEAVYSIIRVSQKEVIKLKALECFSHFLETLESGSHLEEKSQQGKTVGHENQDTELIEDESKEEVKESTLSEMKFQPDELTLSLFLSKTLLFVA